MFFGELMGLFEDFFCFLRVLKFNCLNFEYLKNEVCEMFGFGVMDIENKLNLNDVEYLKVLKVRFFFCLVYFLVMM